MTGNIHTQRRSTTLLHQDQHVRPPYVLAELDHLISTRIGVAAELAMLREFSYPAYELAMMSAADVSAAAATMQP